ncbi:hypothetical protein ASC80_06340 [Afipia sp. Root123D2]|nr:hypothetical protein ASC80_06340 [Afipia sp. Root123D2]
MHGLKRLVELALLNARASLARDIERKLSVKQSRDHTGVDEMQPSKRKRRTLTWLDLLPLIVGFGCAVAMWSAGVVWVIYR